MDSYLTELLITVFLGGFGVHKFMNKETGLGVAYLLTGGLFGIGWFIDIFKVAIKVIKGEQKQYNSNATTQNYSFNENKKRVQTARNNIGQSYKFNSSQPDVPSEPDVHVKIEKVKVDKICEYCGSANDVESRQCYNCEAPLSSKN